ncbi:helix-turn-helix domain-containing protein [Rhizobium bangladeshense]|uniref:helix-turn-helix domain-containing protein n=1 Tax=Rhizobium bangladeshense TaxID=1138189 RepID=UPI001A995E22|nr:AraC family transcriptional regulator [Rhizobium bangladeshense]MBX4892955.1 helix-turn-helix transcriptional regulator [Rhizobium bangladeshense]MBX4917348.1 helix-turn-helix transcriptional regulator [Rhizobium bangladeshense]QSY97468.1 helix-turn-helix transcriptional regulator [Rhizobium bangladeshense]
MIALDELPRREGVELLRSAGLSGAWPISIALWDAPNGFNTSAKPDQQPCHVIALRLSGSLVQRVGSEAAKPERLRPEGFSIHPARQELRFVASSAIRFAHLYVGDRFLSDISGITARTVSEGDAIVPTDRVMYVDAEMSGQLDSYLRRAFEDSDPPTKLEMESRANLIALRLLRYREMQRNALVRPSGSELAPWQVRRICTYLEDNIDRPVRLNELSDMFGMSHEHLCRAFHNATGKPPGQWQLQKRMEIACKLITSSDATLTSIAQEVGYTGQSAFGNAFRDIIGVSPGQYRRTMRGRRIDEHL